MFRDAAASGSSVSDRRHLTCHDQTAMFKPKSTPSSTVLSKATDFAFAADAGFCGGADRRAVALSNHPNICLPTILFGGGQEVDHLLRDGYSAGSMPQVVGATSSRSRQTDDTTVVQWTRT